MRRTRVGLAICGFLATLVITATAAAPPASAARASVKHPPQGIARAGSWLVDPQGRVVELHGFDVVRKTAPFYPSRFTARDAEFLVRNGFTAIRTGFIWSAVEPRPGVYDNGYIRKMIGFLDLLARHGLHALVDFHQDAWSKSAGGDGAPQWATLGSNFLSDFQDFWANAPATDGVGIQTRFVAAWRHVVRRIDASPGAAALIGFDPFNEPYAGLNTLCPPFAPCPAFESGALATFYRRVIAAIRSTGDRHVIFPEGIAQNGIAEPSLPHFDDAQTAFTFHYYCQVTQDATSDSPADEACQPLEQHGVGSFLAYDKKLGVPGLLGEFSCNDADDDNAAMVDLADRSFLTWTAWMYYTAKTDPADCPGQGLLVNDNAPGSVANAKPAKLSAFEVPFPRAIAGRPGRYSYDRTTRVMTLTYVALPVPGTSLQPATATDVFVPRLVYPHGYRVAVTGARVTSPRDTQRLALAALRPGARVVVTVRPA